MKLTKKQIFWAAVIFAFLACGGYITYTQMQVSEASAALEQLKGELLTTNKNAKSLDDVAERLERAKGLVRKVVDKSLPVEDLVGNQQIFYNAEATAAVKIQVLRQGNVTKLEAAGKKYALINYKVMAQGSYGQIGDFLAMLLSSDCIMRISNFAIQRSTISEGGAQSFLNPLVINMDVEVIAK